MSGELFSQTLLVGINLGAFYSLIALGFTLMYGIMGVLNMAHGTIYMVGAMIAFYIYGQAGLSFFIALPLAMVITGLFGVLVERFLNRRCDVSVRRWGLGGARQGSLRLAHRRAQYRFIKYKGADRRY